MVTTGDIPEKFKVIYLIQITSMPNTVKLATVVTSL